LASVVESKNKAACHVYTKAALARLRWPTANPLFTTERGKRYRLAMSNKSGDNHPVHLHRHTFEVTKVGISRRQA